MRLRSVQAIIPGRGLIMPSLPPSRPVFCAACGGRGKPWAATSNVLSVAEGVLSQWLANGRTFKYFEDAKTNINEKSLPELVPTHTDVSAVSDYGWGFQKVRGQPCGDNQVSREHLSPPPSRHRAPRADGPTRRRGLSKDSMAGGRAVTCRMKIDPFGQMLPHQTGSVFIGTRLARPSRSPVTRDIFF